MPAHLRHSWRDLVAVLILSLIAFAFLLAGWTSNAKAATPIPDNPGTYVVDQTGILSPADKQRVEKRLAEFERSSPDRPQFVVLILKDLPEQGMEEFATDTFRKWKVGQKGLDNGALEVIHPKSGNHADVRLEIGRGLEGAIPDLSASDINRKVLGPLWVKGQYADGIIAIADTLAKGLDPVASPIVASNQQQYYQEVSKPQGRNNFGGWAVGLLIFGLGLGFLFVLLRRERRQRKRSTLGSNVKVDVKPYPYQDDNYHAAQAAKLERTRDAYRTAQTASRPTPPRTGSAITPPRRTGSSAASTIAAGAAGVAAGMAAEEIMNRRRREQEREEEDRRRRRRDEDNSSNSSSSWTGYTGASERSSSYDSGGSSSSGSSDSGYSGGGGDSGGGGSSDSF